ncbi:MAG: type II toxin-antitoxin system VapC family toxin [Nitrospirae bacterium]|nr:type II toxin-antitoxin system VapC family toxin [Nitrospirota bacterium]
MILYFGTSSLVKLYLDEPHSGILREWAKVAEMLATCRIAITEVMSAIDQRFRNNDLSKKNYDMLIKQLSEDWAHFVKVDFNDVEAGTFVNKYGLTRFGAIHLSSAKLIKEEQRKLSHLFKKSYGDQGDVSLFFVSSDEKLCKAASVEGLRVLPLG